jgi:hypothetical protein
MGLIPHVEAGIGGREARGLRISRLRIRQSIASSAGRFKRLPGFG